MTAREETMMMMMMMISIVFISTGSKLRERRSQYYEA